MNRDLLENVAKKKNVGGYKRHIFLCIGPSCCSEEAGLELWEHLKDQLKAKGLTEGPVYRTKAGCLRMCCEGPIAVVYPDGTWYGGLTVEKLDRIIAEHLADGKPIAEYSFAANPLPNP